MKLLSYEVGGVQGYGAIAGNGIVDLARRFGRRFPTLRELLAAAGLEQVAEVVAGASPDYGLDGIRFQLPIPSPEKIMCVGVNYPERNAEYKDSSALQQRPSLFLRVARSFVPHRAEIIRPPESQQLDYEGELVVIIGKPGRRIPAAKAMEHVAGFSIMNEGTIRDWIRHAKFNNTQGKNWERSGSIALDSHSRRVPGSGRDHYQHMRERRASAEGQAGEHALSDSVSDQLHLHFHRAFVRRCHCDRHPNGSGRETGPA